MIKKAAVAVAALTLAMAASATTTEFSFDEKVKVGKTFTFTFDVGTLAGVLNGTIFGVTKQPDPTFLSLELDGVTVSAFSTSPPNTSIWSFQNLAIAAGSHTITSQYAWLPVFGAVATAPKAQILGALTFTPVTTPVPEPESYALFLAGLGMLGFMAKRRRQA
jgi:hypothetical protein